MTDQAGHQGASISTRSTSVSLLTTPADVAHLTLNVEGFVTTNGVTTSIGATSTKVTVVDHIPGTAAGTLQYFTFQPEPLGPGQTTPDQFIMAMFLFPINKNAAYTELFIDGQPYGAVATAASLIEHPPVPLINITTSANMAQAAVRGSGGFYLYDPNTLCFPVLSGDLGWYSATYFKNYVQQEYAIANIEVQYDPTNIGPTEVRVAPKLKVASREEVFNSLR